MRNAHLAVGVALLGFGTAAITPPLHAASATYDGPCIIRPPIAAASWGSSAKRGTIEGHVFQIEALTDTSERPLNDAEVIVAGPVKQSIAVDGAGQFSLANLPAGRYAVTVRREGFPTRRDSVVIGSSGAIGDIRLRRTAQPSGCPMPRPAATQAPNGQ